MNVNLRVISVAVTIALGTLGAIQIVPPESLGISPVAARWLTIIVTALGIAQGFLPRVQGPVTDPSVIADRVWNLPDRERQKVAEDLARRAEHEALGHAIAQRTAGLVSRPPEWLPKEGGR